MDLKSFKLVGNDIGMNYNAEGEASVVARDVYDGYHTFTELYEHRLALNVALCHSIQVNIGLEPRLIENIQLCKSKLHNDETMFEGDYFIVVINFYGKQISYHYKLEHWDKFKIPEVDKIPWKYDGHTPQDCIERLLSI